ncbi:MAG: DivIVA domain-containing protein [Pseudolysinimonas sp.]|uniref:DivIVA domain-containing protein n=1 Tax=Pseudolysinimonas sp. TaxID=2680009 RepID=UPI0032655234
MALTPEDVVNKRFNPTKFREGYDQDEVDDFLDEVVVELRRLNQENDELRQRIVAGESRVAEMARAAQSAPQAIAPQTPVAAPVPEQATFAPGGFDPNAMDLGSTNNLLQSARRLHEEHVREGMEKRDALISEGHAAAARVVSDAEQGARSQVESLQREKQELERKLDELRTFEREYRTKLKGYIEGQLRELETSNAIGAGPAAVTGGQYAQAVAAPVAPASYAPPQPDYAAYPQPTDYPPFGSGN